MIGRALGHYKFEEQLGAGGLVVAAWRSGPSNDTADPTSSNYDVTPDGQRFLIIKEQASPELI